MNNSSSLQQPTNSTIQTITNLNASSQFVSTPNECTTKTTKKVYTDFKSANWIDNFAPQTIDDLAVHHKKINELYDWFQNVEQNKHKIPG